MRYFTVFFLLLLSILVLALQPQKISAAEIRKNEAFKKSKFKQAFLKKHFKARYPRELGKKGNAGIVEIDFMVDVDGKAFEPIVTMSTDPLFEKNALKSIKQNTYEPAYLGEKAIQSNYTTRVFFRPLLNLEGVTEKFAIDFKKAKEILNSENASQETAKAFVNKLKNHKNLTEYALNNIHTIDYFYAKRFTNLAEQINALEKLNLYERVGQNLLDAKLELSMNTELLNHYINIKDYAKARNLLNYMLRQTDQPSKIYKKVDQQLKSIQSDNKPFEAAITINSKGFALRTLIRNSFAFFDIKGKVNDVSLRCARNYKKLTVIENQTYQIPKPWGMCDLYVSGEPGSGFALVQQ